jgi:hypothetical protein
MKKIVVFLMALFVGLVTVNAMTESELETKLTKQYTMNGVIFEATDSQKVLVKRYLDQYEVSSADCDYIAKKFDEAMEIVKASGVKDLYKLSRADKDKIIALVADVSANTSVTASIVKGTLVVYVPGTSDVFAKEQIFPKNGDVVQTSGNVTIAVAGLVSVLGLAIALRKLRANA